MNTSRIVILASLLTTLLGCGGDPAPPPQTGPSKVEQSEMAISIIRNSFDAMGGLERLRLSGGKVKVKAKVNVGGTQFPVEYMFGGPSHYRMDYVEEEISFMYSKGACRKVAYGVSAHCTPAEAMWLVPVKIFTGLTFPFGDAAKLDASFTMREDMTGGGKSLVVTEIRPKNTNLKIRCGYDKATGLLAQAAFYLKDAQDTKTNWEMHIGGWQEVKKMQVTTGRTITLEGREVWKEDVTSVDFDAYDVRAFDAPLPPSTDHPHKYNLPARRYTRSVVEGQAVEIPAPFPTIGGGAIPNGEILTAPAAEIIRIVHRGPVGEVAKLLPKLDLGANALGRQTIGDPGVMLLEEPSSEGESVLMMVYVGLAPQDVSVKITL